MAHPSTALQLAQLGEVSSSRWAKRLGPLQITPSEGVVLRLIATADAPSQREVAAAIGIAPSRVVALVDALEDKGLVQRRRSQEDRRRQELALTPNGTQTMRRLAAAGRHHEAEVVGALSEPELDQLRGLLAKLLDAHGVRDGIHPRVGR